mmetsp:Transcript_12237/g.24146  ORF Transcript_12237/g.24146 Transcript_12237/m.24146 type:complete len:453 (-) Transcript_12237:97-1455(-)
MSQFTSKMGSIDVAELQREMVMPDVSHAKNVVKEMLSTPLPHYDPSLVNDPQVLRGQLLELQARLRSLQTSAEQACFEVEHRYRAEDANISRVSSDANVSSTRKVSAVKIQTHISNESSPIPLLDAIHDLISAEQNESSWDLLKDDDKTRGTNSTVGIRLGMNAHAKDLSSPCQIQIIIPGSSAHICNKLSRGDEIVRVDGNLVDESNIVASVKGMDQVGSKVTLGVRKNGRGQEFQVELVRGAWGAVERKEKLFIKFDEAQALVERDGTREEVLDTLRQCISLAMENEKYRALNEMRIQGRLQHLQAEMKRLVSAAKRRCKALMTAHSEANDILSRQASELTIPLHDRVVDYVQGLQAELEEAQMKLADAEGRAAYADQVIDAVKDVEAAAAFARGRMRNWEFGVPSDVVAAALNASMNETTSPVMRALSSGEVPVRSPLRSPIISHSPTA